MPVLARLSSDGEANYKTSQHHYLLRILGWCSFPSGKRDTGTDTWHQRRAAPDCQKANTPMIPSFTVCKCEISIKHIQFEMWADWDLNNFHYLYTQTKILKDMQDVNRLKLVLVEQKKTSKWLSEELGVSQSTVSKWCTNSSQPDIETLAKISKLLNVGLEELFNKQFMESVSF